MTQNEEFGVVLTGEIKEIEARFEPICQELNRNPIKISQGLYGKELAKAQATFTALESALRKETGNPKFRANATADCYQYFHYRGAEFSRLTEGGKACIDKGVLKNLAERFPIAQTVIDAREALSVLGQLRKWKEYADAKEAQPQWNQFGTPMGRMSCEAPALQNRVMEVRATVVPSDGFTFLSCDLGQAEYRMWANLSNDSLLKAAFDVKGADFHQVMGESLAAYLPKGVPVRKAGKTINFALLYQMSAPTLADSLGVDIDVAKAIISQYQGKAKVAHQYAMNYLAKAKATGVVETAFGRKRVLPGLKSADRKVLRDAEKTAWHHHNAGSAADLFKWLMCEVHSALVKAGMRDNFRWVLNMHDEFIMEVRKGYELQIRNIVDYSIKSPREHWLPMAHTIVLGDTWAALDS